MSVGSFLFLKEQIKDIISSSPLSLILTLTLVRSASFLFPLWGAYRDCFQVFLSLCVFFSSGFPRGGIVSSRHA
jgi:hypothetical protein